jgi:hypothetical protein
MTAFYDFELREAILLLRTLKAPGHLKGGPETKSQKPPFLRLMKTTRARLANRHKTCCNTYLEIKVSKLPAQPGL